MMAASVGSTRRFAMPALRSLCLGILLWGLMGSAVRADAIRWQRSADNWIYYLAGQNGGTTSTPAVASDSSAAAASDGSGAAASDSSASTPAPAPTAAPAY